MKAISLVALALVCFAGNALADSTHTFSTSVENSSQGPFALDRFYVGYFGSLEGSKLNQFGSPYQVSSKGAMTSQPMTFASDVTAAYLITPNVGVGTYIEANLTPFFGQGVQFLDVGLTTFDKKLVSSNGLTVFGNLIVELPTSSYDINRGMYAGYETTPYVRYDVPHSHFSLGAWTELKDYAGSSSGKLVKTYANPYVAYQLLPSLAANLGYEVEYDHFAGTSGFSVYESDFQPGLIWNIGYRFFFNPYLQFFTNNQLSFDTAAFGATIVARVL